MVKSSFAIGKKKEGMMYGGKQVSESILRDMLFKKKLTDLNRLEEMQVFYYAIGALFWLVAYICTYSNFKAEVLLFPLPPDVILCIS